MIAMATLPVRRQRAVACLSVAIASLLTASGVVVTERAIGRDLSKMLADVLRPPSGQAPPARDSELAGGLGTGNAGAGHGAAASPGATPASGGGQPGGAGSGGTAGGGGADTPGGAGQSGPGGTTPGSGGPGTAGSGSGGAGDPPGGGGATPGPGPGPGTPNPPAPGPEPGPGNTRHPLEAEVEALKPFVEREAALGFKTSVPVRILSDGDFSTRLAQLNWLPKGDTARHLEGVYRALGLIGSNVDLPTELAKFTVAEVVTLYDAVERQLLIRNRQADPYLRSMLVRELTRALNDQHFRIYRSNLDGFYGEARDGLKALVEGDATRVQNRYLENLSPVERAQADAERARIANQTPANINRAVLLRFTYAVSQGLRLVENILSAGGRARLNAAFASPPTSSEQVLNPDRFLAGDAPKPVAEPAADGPVVSRGVLGQIGLYTMLSEAIDDPTATQASHGWGGDRYVSWRDGTRTCVRQAIVMDTPEDSARLAAALQQWAQARPGAEISGSGPFTIKRCA